MRIFWLILFLSFSISCGAFAAGNSDVLNLAGGGVIFSTSPYQGVKNRIMPVPFLMAEHKGFYIKGIEAGYRFWETGPFTFSVVGNPRFMGYSSEDSSALSGMEDRRMSLDAGLKAEYALPWQDMTVTAKTVADILGRNNGSEYELSLGRTFKGNIFRLMPSAGVRYQSRHLVDYYYGVQDNEARAGRPAYAADGALNPFANMVFSVGVARKLIVMGMLGIESLGSEIRKSPLVDENYGLTAAAGLTYRF